MIVVKENYKKFQMHSKVKDSIMKMTLLVIGISLTWGCASSQKIETGEPRFMGYQYALYWKDDGKTGHTIWTYDMAAIFSAYQTIDNDSYHYWIERRPVYK
jgi:hypothetical protein